MMLSALNICFFIYFTATSKKKIILEEKEIVKRKIFLCEISIIILICQKLESVRPVQQKIKLPSPNHHGIPNLGYVSIT